MAAGLRAGSSPRVRGKVWHRLASGEGGGIIPAGAGKRGRGRPGREEAGDHPRGCGEKAEALKARVFRLGSSPRVRGKGSVTPAASAFFGIIPAGAGKRPSPRATSQSRRDHPRGCGEKQGRRRRAEVFPGSSPRVRGKVRVAPISPRLVGIIPAGAGKRGAGRPDCLPTRDHPRGCGEKTGLKTLGDLVEGSSPRVRGKVGSRA